MNPRIDSSATLFLFRLIDWIEQVFSKLKRLLRKANERTVEVTWRRIGTLLDALPHECAKYIRRAGHASM